MATPAGRRGPEPTPDAPAAGHTDARDRGARGVHQPIPPGTAELGLSPAAAARLVRPLDPDEEDPFD